ncbi:UNVERIFIED_CONTAM: hypothetical protein Scaly_1553900 [Sesamum calycinum]|uniref:Uncharacterized protein n=1 Tax=Sesamum calycinum TaxID=2727403 RepID=A0AAW2P6S0_9LAMI
MAAFHSRSNSFPSQSHPIMDVVENHLCRLKSSEAASTSATSVCTNLGSLRDLHEGINNLIQMASVQQALSNEQDDKWINELLDGSLRLVDLCGFSRDVVCLTKESVQDLESSIRRNKGEKERSKQKSWSLLSKFTQTSRVHSEVQQEAGAENLCSFNTFKSLKSMDNIALQSTLKASEMTIEKLEEGLEALFRSLVKTRVSLLNVLSH